MKKLFLVSMVLFISGVLFFAEPPALPNLGNTCFMNALIQSMNVCVPVRHYLVQQGAQAYQNNPFLSNFVTLLENIQAKKPITTSLKSFVASSCPLFQRGAQDDAARLFGELIDQFKNEPYEKSRLGRKEQTLAQFFEFTEKLITTCGQDGILLEKNEPAFYLKVPVVGDRLQDCFKKYLGGPLEDFRGRKDCSQESKIMNLPEIFVIGLNRFEYDPLKQDLISHKKSIDIPAILPKNDLQPLMYNQNTQIDDYQLIAIVMHHGSTVSGGHYTAYVRELDGDDVWYFCNDSSITRGGKQLAIVPDYNYKEDGYLFFYMSTTMVKQVIQDAATRKKLELLGQALASLAHGS